MKQTQLLKGVLEGCVLEMIAQKESYGYELIQRLKEVGFETLVGGTLYPLLQKLEKNGWIVGEMRSSPDGPDRKYFSISEEGVGQLAVFWDQWSALTTTVDRVHALKSKD